MITEQLTLYVATYDVFGPKGYSSETAQFAIPPQADPKPIVTACVEVLKTMAGRGSRVELTSLIKKENPLNKSLEEL